MNHFAILSWEERTKYKRLSVKYWLCGVHLLLIFTKEHCFAKGESNSEVYAIRDIFWFFFVYKQINSLEASLGINQFVFYSCAMIRYSINLWRRLIVLEESSTVTFSMEVWVSDWFDCYIWLWCKYTKRSSSINA